MPREALPFHYKPQDGYVGDCIPCFFAGRYELYYLKRYTAGGPYEWYRLTSTDLLDWQAQPRVLAAGPPGAPDCGGCWTGSVLHHQGTFHVFYTGWNPDARFPQTICHATSTDQVHWEKDPLNPLLVPDETWYESSDWRDPFVFYNEDAGEWWMLICARTKGAEPRRGCLALATSPDLVQWRVKPPFYQPHQAHVCECPDLFSAGGRHYLLWSWSAWGTQYRLADSLSGPWRQLDSGRLCSANCYAAKRLFDGKRHLLFGWIPWHVDASDSGPVEWAGHLALPRELVPRPDGTLGVRLPAEVIAALPPARPDFTGAFHPLTGGWQVSETSLRGRYPAGRAFARLAVPPDYALHFTLTLEEGCTRAGLLLRTDESYEHGYLLSFDKPLHRVGLAPWQQGVDLPPDESAPCDCSERLEVFVFLSGSVLEVFVSGRAALSRRAFDYSAGDLLLWCDAGPAAFDDFSLHPLAGD